MSDPQEYKTINEQINLLKARNLSFEDEKYARHCLREYGYYSIINGYKEPYLDNPKGTEDHYKDGVTFEQILSLFTFDHHVKSAVMISMLDFEEHLRAVTAEIIASAYTSNHNEYLKPEHYQDRKLRKKANAKFSRAKILEKMTKELYSDHDPIKYSMDKYNNVPPWILFKGLYFNTLVNFVRIQKGDVKTQIMCRMYNIRIPDDINPSELKSLFTDSLFIFLAYRNAAAHGGRIYNLKPSTQIEFNKGLKNTLAKMLTQDAVQGIENSNGLWQMVELLGLFLHKEPYSLTLNAITEALIDHCSKYPQDIEYITNTTGINLDNIHIRTEDVEHTLRDYLNLRTSATSLSEAATTTEFTTDSN